MNATETANYILLRIDDPRVIVGPLYLDHSKPTGYQLRLGVTTHKLAEGNLTTIIELYDTPTNLAQSFRANLILEIRRLYNYMLLNKMTKPLDLRDLSDPAAVTAAEKELEETGGGGL